MFGESIVASLIASGIASSASISGSTVYQKISDKLSSSDAEILSEAFIENLTDELAGESLSGISEEELTEVFEHINTASLDSVFQSRDDLVQFISSQISADYTSISLSESISVESAVSTALDESVSTWFKEVDQETTNQLLLRSNWEEIKQVREIAEQLNASLERQRQEKWHTTVEVDDPNIAADQVSKLLDLESIDGNTFVDRPEIPSEPDQERYLVIGRHGLGKTRTLDYLQRQYLKQYPIKNVVVPRDGFLKPGDAQAISAMGTSGDILLVWDDIGGLAEGAQDTTVRETILRLSEQTAQNGNRLFVLTAVRSGQFDSLDNINRSGDRLWGEFETINLDPLSTKVVGELCEIEVDSSDIALSDTELAHLKDQVRLADPSPLYIDSAVSTIDPSKETSVLQQIKNLPSDVEGIWNREYELVCREHPKARFILWSMSLLRMGGIPAYKTTLREVYTQVFNQDEFSFKQPLQVLLQRQWIWKGGVHNHDVDQTVYESRDAQMDAVDEDDTRVIEQFAEFLLSSLEDTIPDAVVDFWLPHYHANIGAFFTVDILEDTLKLAEPQFARALELSPLSPSIRNNYATYLQAQNRFNEAVSQYEMILSVAPDWVDIKLTYATTLDELGRKWEAKKHYYQVINSEAHLPEAHSNLGMLYHDLGQFNKAREQFEIALSKGDLRTENYNNLGALYSDRGDLLEAINTWKQGLEVDPWNREIRINLAACYIKLEYPNKARDLLEPLAESDELHSDAEVHGRLALAYAGLGKSELTEEHWEYAKNAENGRNPLGENFLEETVIEDITSDSYYQDKPDLIRVIDHLMTEGAYQTAFDKAQQLLNQGYESENVYLQLGDLSEEIGRPENAHEYYQKAISTGEETAQPYHHYANLCKHQGDFKKASELFKKALGISRSPPILCDYGLFLITTESYDSAEKVFGEAIAIDDYDYSDSADKKRVLLNYGELLRKKGENKAAKAHMQRALNIDPQYNKGKFGISQVEIMLENYDSAIDFLTQSISGFAAEGMFKEWSMALLQCIFMLREKNEIQQALELCQHGIEIAQTQGNRGFQLISILEGLQYELQKVD